VSGSLGYSVHCIPLNNTLYYWGGSKYYLSTWGASAFSQGSKKQFMRRIIPTGRPRWILLSIPLTPVVLVHLFLDCQYLASNKGQHFRIKYWATTLAPNHLAAVGVEAEKQCWDCFSALITTLAFVIAYTAPQEPLTSLFR
jgi:hypothetical protein